MSLAAALLRGDRARVVKGGEVLAEGYIGLGGQLKGWRGPLAERVEQAVLRAPVRGAEETARFIARFVEGYGAALEVG